MRACLLLALVACTSDTPEDAPPGLADNFGETETVGTPGCDNLLANCLLPFPSDAYLDRSSGTPSVVLPVEGVPTNTQGQPFGVDGFRALTGFGTASPVLFQLPGAEVPELTVFDPEPSLQDAARTVLVDAETGERIGHWLETDVLAAQADPTLLTLRPSVPLPRGRTIVVGVRGFVDADGAEVEAPPPFAALRDGEASTWLGVHARRAHFEDAVFPTLEAAGVPRSSLQLAWSFTVASADDANATILATRDRIFEALPDDGPAVIVDEVRVCDAEPLPEGCHGSIRVILDGHVEVPSVLGEADAAGVRTMNRDADGLPVVDGVETWPFTLQLPHAAFTGEGPVPVLQYGHGFKGSEREADNGWLRDMADRLGFAILATPMQGMNERDALVWTAVLLGDAGRFTELADAPMQGVVNQLVMQRMLSTRFADEAPPELLRDDGTLAWDRDTVWYYGNSQGGTVGTVVMALSLDVQRGVLGVPGASYPLLLHRSTVFTDELAAILAATYPGPDSVSVFLALLGTGWDPFESLGLAPHIHGDPLPGTPDHEVLLHAAKEDHQVHNELSFALGRASGAVLMTPAVRPVWGLPEQAYPASPGAAVVEVDFSVPDDPTPLDPPAPWPDLPNGGDTHGWLRAWEPAQDQMVHFLRTGELVDVCDGAACIVDGKP
jgi:hypothetical protein